LKKGIKDTVIYDEDLVRERFGFGPELLPDYKGLRGDPSDNIVGVAGIGEKTATELIQKFGTIENLFKTLKKDKSELEKAGVKNRVIELLEANEEEAKFSKMLATIRRDAPIDFSLEKTKWPDSTDIQKILDLFAELDFKTLGPRVREVLAPETIKLIEEKSDSENAPIKKKAPGKQNLFNQAEAEKINPRELKETSIALWLIDSDIANPTLEDILNYAGSESFEEAKKKIFADLEREDLLKVYEKIEKPLIPVIEKMQGKGVKIDKNYLNGLSKEYHKELSALEKGIWKEAGGEFNINSPKQLGDILFDKLGLSTKNQKKTAGGARSTRESELEKMRDLHPIIDSVLKYRELQKLLSTYIDNIPTMTNADDRLHTTFQQTGTTTGRMSSQNPNLQNIPIKTEQGRKIRNAFVAEKGFKLVSFDYSQIELRIAAFLSGDPKLVEIFKNGEDVHTAVASEVFGVPKEKVDAEMRRRAKVINFGIIYGMGVNALKQNLGTSREEAQKFYDEYFGKFSTLAVYLEKIKAEARKNGYTKTYFGRRRNFPDMKSKLPYIRAMAERMAINAPLQGTAADVIKIAMIKVDEYIRKNGLENKVFLLLQVHDELVFEIADSEIKKVAPELKRVIERVLEKEEKAVPIETSGEIGENWGEMEDLS
jgi:DNA polymerase-1